MLERCETCAWAAPASFDLMGRPSTAHIKCCFPTRDGRQPTRNKTDSCQEWHNKKES